MDAAGLLFRLLALLLAARLAAELAERLRMPAVLVEITAGVVLGPSLLGFVGHEESLHFLGELGAVFLLLEVGLHMDLGDLKRVGRAAVLVAAVGVAVPMLVGTAGMRAIGIDAQIALFLGAGITATSVGITARVFADMRALATREAQTILGAAVADDVVGLLILTVVVRLSQSGGVDAGSIALIAVTGLAFVVVATALGSWLAPRLFDGLVSRARTEGTLIGAAVAFTLAFAGLAAAAKLAPIVGAFVAGLSLGRIHEQEDLRRRLAPVTHLFVPVFFLLIGAEARVGALSEPGALQLIAVLGSIAVIGKLIAGFAIRRGSADRLLVGIGMIPRGEVGVVFATLGLASGVLHAREHAALLTVVLATTMVAPPWLRIRIERMRRKALEHAADVAPAGGWLVTDDRVCELRAEPPFGLAPKLGLEAALLCSERRPGPHLLEWLGRASAQPPQWDDELRALFLDLLRSGHTRSWRLLDVTGLLPSLVPEIGAELRRRKQDPFDLDPAGALRWEEVEAVIDLVGRDDPAARLWTSVDQDAVLVAALARSAFRGANASSAARKFAATLGLEGGRPALVEFLTMERDLLPAASSRIATLGSEEAVLELAAHIGSKEHTDALYLLSAAITGDPVQREALNELHALLIGVLSQPELTGTGVDLTAVKRTQAVEQLAHVADPVLMRLVDAAPRRYLLVHTPQAIARHVRMLEPPLTRGEVRIHAEPDLERSEWTIDIVTMDRPGALTAIAHAFASSGIPILEAWISTWTSGVVVDVFRTSASPDVDWANVRDTAATALSEGPTDDDGGRVEGRVHVDNAASPWHTIVEITAQDRTALLHRVAVAFSRARIDVHHATVRTVEGVAIDSFLVSKGGGKLAATDERDLRLSLDGKKSAGWRRRRPGRLSSLAPSRT